MSLRTGKPFEDFEKSGEDDYYEFLYDQYIALQKQVEVMSALLAQSSDAPLYEAWMKLNKH